MHNLYLKLKCWQRINHIITFAIMKRLLLVLYVLGCLLANAQDTTYFNLFWKPCEKVDASYFRLTTEKEGIYEMNDYFIKTGKLQMSGFYKDASAKISHGKFTWYYKSGNLQQIIEYADGKELNDTTVIYADSSNKLIVSERRVRKNDTLKEIWIYYPSGSCYEHKKFENGEIRTIFAYYETAEIKRKEYFNKKGEFRNGMCYTRSGEDTAYFPALIYPKIDGKNPVLEVDFIATYIIYPEDAKINGIEGRAVVSYVIEADGSISNINIEYASHHLFGESLIATMQATAGRWQPGRIEGKLAPIKLTLPIKYTLY